MKVAGIIPEASRQELEFIQSMLMLGDWVRFLAEEGELGGKAIGGPAPPSRKRPFRASSLH